MCCGTEFISTEDECHVSESDDGAKLKEAVLRRPNVTFFMANEKAIRTMPELIGGLEPLGAKKACDGAIIVHDGESEKMYLIDLKSRLNTKKILDAFIQDVCSLFRLNMILPLCNGYDFKVLPIEMIVACLCFENQDQKDGVYTKLDKEIKQGNELCKLLYRLMEGGSVDIPLSKIPQVAGIKGLASSYLDKSVVLSLRLTKNYTDNSITINL
jgi:hypothetical protein